MILGGKTREQIKRELALELAARRVERELRIEEAHGDRLAAHVCAGAGCCGMRVVVK